MSAARQHVFLTGGSGYMGSRLIPRLLSRGHRVTALVRPHSQGKLPSGCEAVLGMRWTALLIGSASSRRQHWCNWWAYPIPAPPKRRNFAASIW
ncbi:MAG: hypothetical protein DMG82_26455 [Acidobacteria bacterium]|nr:MAG: hypothetical protein DMG82_26455 [Acidobacteriota bacterium]